MKITWVPEDLWVGIWLDRDRRRVYVCPLPTVALRWDLAPRAAVTRYEMARYMLNENNIAEAASGVRDETEEFHRLNREVARAELGISRLRAWWIDRRITARQDYWPRLEVALAAGDQR